MNQGALLFYIISLIILILLSGFFSSSETAYTSMSKARLKNLSKNKKNAKLALKLNENYHKLLTTILIGNNLVNIAAASLATVVFVHYFGKYGVTISTIILTIVLLIFSEISPKSIAKKKPEKVAMVVSKPLSLISKIFSPFTFVFNGIEKVLVKVFKLEKSEPYVTEDELKIIVSDISNEGILNDIEHELIQKSLLYDDIIVKSIMSPLNTLISIRSKEGINSIANVFYENGLSRVPVIDNNEIVGIIYLKDFFELMIEKKESISEIIEQPLIAYDFIKISLLFKRMQYSKNHFAIIVNRERNPIGFVTMEDILEELVGEIDDEHDE